MNTLWYCLVYQALMLPVLLIGQSTPSDFYEINKIQQIDITFDKDSWRYYLDSLRYNGDELLIGNIRINGEALPEVGVRYQSSRRFQPGQKRNSLHIELDLIHPDQVYESFSTLRLSNALRDPSMVREVLAYDIAGQYMPAPRANYAKVYINGEYYGLFVNIEAIDERFLEKHFGDSDGTFLHATPLVGESAPEGCKSELYSTLQYDNSAKCYVKQFSLYSRRGWDDLIELTRILAEKPEISNRILNVDRTLWMHAFNNAIGNLASYTGQYSQNYFLYQDHAGQFNPIVTDLNFAFGSYKNTGLGSDLGVRDMIKLDPLLHAETAGRPLISALLGQEKYRKMYLSHYHTILQDHFRGDKFANRVKQLQAMIRSDYVADLNKFYPAEDFDRSAEEIIGKRSRIPGIADYMTKREDWLITQPPFKVLPPEVTSVTVQGREKFSTTKVDKFAISAKIDKFPKEVQLIYRLTGQPNFTVIPMMDDGEHGDGKANDAVFGAVVIPDSKEQGIEYFIVAENAQTIGYSPRRYMFERHKTDLETLNR